MQRFQVLAHVAMRLKDLHNAGYVHRDIKPGNIMLLHRKNRWTLIDFGCVAPIDELTGLSFTLLYAAPEAVETWYRGAVPAACMHASRTASWVRRCWQSHPH